MQNENTVQNTEVLPQTDRLLDSPPDNQITEPTTEPTTTEEPEATENSERSDNPEETVSKEESETVEETETTEEETVVYQTAEVIDYTEALTEINSTLHHIDETVELGVCLFIIVVIILLMHYVYKFFKMFF